MKCPTCSGDKIISVFGFIVPSIEEPYTTMTCHTCEGKGEIDDNHPKWLKVGHKLKDARIERRETLRKFCKRVGEDPHVRSKMERGLIKPVDKYGELKK